jgi:hypothetical protein
VPGFVSSSTPVKVKNGRLIQAPILLRLLLVPGFATGKPFPALKRSACFLVHWAGTQAERQIEQAKAEQAGPQRNYADPTPHADLSCQRQPYQGQSNYNAHNAVDTANIGFHDVLLAI